MRRAAGEAVTSRSIAGMKLVDSHAHLQADAFADDREVVVAAAREAGVSRLLVPGWDVETSRAAVESAAPSERMYAAVGIHPHVAAQDHAAGWGEVLVLAEDTRLR